MEVIPCYILHFTTNRSLRLPSPLQFYYCNMSCLVCSFPSRQFFFIWLHSRVVKNMITQVQSSALFFKTTNMWGIPSVSAVADFKQSRYTKTKTKAQTKAIAKIAQAFINSAFTYEKQPLVLFPGFEDTTLFPLSQLFTVFSN